MWPSISVVIPAYNAEAQIERALTSVAAQTLRPLDIVVVDDGSADATAQRVKEFCFAGVDLPVKLVTQTNKGPGAARNRGITATDGEYIAFLDADDVWYPQKLERVTKAIMAHPNAALFCHDEYFSADGYIQRRVRAGPAMDNMYDYLLFRRNCILTSAVVLQKNALSEVGKFSEDRAMDSCEDWDLWLRLARAGYSFFFLPEALGERILGGNSLSANIEKHFQTELNVLKRHFDSSGALQTHPNKCRRRLAQASYGKARGYYRAKQIRHALYSYRECIGRDPLFLRAYVGLGILLLRLPL